MRQVVQERYGNDEQAGRTAPADPLELTEVVEPPRIPLWACAAVAIYLIAIHALALAFFFHR